MSIISVQNLSKKYLIRHEGAGYITLRDQMAHPIKAFRNKLTNKPEEFWALKDISFEVEAGEVVGIIGPNGSGKSTLLKVLSRITPPTKGRAVLRGRVASLLEVGTGFHPELSGRENIFLSGIILGMTKLEVQKKFDEIVEFAGVEKFLDTPIKYYSSGMGVRLGFAVAAHLNSEILIIDEVLAVGDADFQKKCLAKMDDVAKNQGRTILFVSHNMAAIDNICDKGICLRSGVIQHRGSKEEIINFYLHKTEDKNKDKIAAADMIRKEQVSLKAKVIEFNLFQNDVKNPVNIDSTKSIKVFIKLDAQEDLELGFYANIKHSPYDLVLLFDSWCLNKQLFKINKGQSDFILDIDPTFLTSGGYSMDIALLLPNDGWADIVRDIYSFNVPVLDPFGVGYNFLQSASKYFVNHRWDRIK